MINPYRAAGLVLAVLLVVLSPAAARPAEESVEDLLFDLQLVPLDGQAPPPFTLEALDGPRVSLSQFKGQIVLLYFWASW